MNLVVLQILKLIVDDNADCRLGGDVVLTEQELRATKLFRSGELPRPVLGLNCVGGDSSAEMCKALGRRVKGEESIEIQRIFANYIYMN